MITQIYEIQTPEEARSMLDLGVDHLGSVLLDEGSWRNPEIRETIRVVQKAGKVASLIPLFGTPETVEAVAEWYAPDILHFCEEFRMEDLARDASRLKAALSLQQRIRKRFPDIRIMRAIPVMATGAKAPLLAESASLAMTLARKFAPVTDFFLTDTVIPGNVDQPVPGFVGITGETCDWNICADLVRITTVPVILAGGLDPHNVQDGIRAVNPFGVDSCTRTNAVDGNGRSIRFRKDAAKVRAFVEESRKMV